MISKSRIKHIRSLQLKKFRDEHAEFIVEGEKMVLEAMQLEQGLVDSIYYTTAFPAAASDLSPHPAFEITEAELKQISSLQTPNKALAVLKKPKLVLKTLPFYLALDGVQDPGNMGTLLRLADWFGVPEILCSQETVDCYNPKVVQATMGALYRVQVHYVDLKSHLQELGLPVYGALLSGENVYKEALLPEGVLVLGNEGSGISAEVQAIIDRPIHIPRLGGAESLNVSTAGAILLAEFFRNVLSGS
jgi:TrmH family RNA methyltransferase